MLIRFLKKSKKINEDFEKQEELKIKNPVDYQYGCEILLKFITLKRTDKELCKTFCCNNSHIDKFVKSKSFKDNSSVTYAAIDFDLNRIICIITLQASSIYTNSTNLLKYPKHDNIPAMEIKYFAVDSAYQHMPYSVQNNQTLSVILFLKYIDDIKEISKNICGIEKIILYSVPKAINFYKKVKFIEYKKYMAKSQHRSINGCIPMFYSLNS